MNRPLHDGRTPGLPPSPLSTTLLVRGYRLEWAWVLVLFGAGLAVWAQVGGVGGRQERDAMSVMGAVTAGTTVLVGLWGWWRRRTVTILNDGIVVSEPFRVRTIDDADVARVAVSVRALRDLEGTGTLRRTIRMELREPAGEVVRLDVDELPGDTGRPAAVLVERLIACIAARWETDLAKGRPIRGDGWELAADRIIVAPDTPAETVVPRPQVADVGLVGGRFNVWRVGGDQPVLSLPADAWDVPVLHRTLLPWGLATQESGKDRIAPDSPGRLLFERRPSAWPAFLVAAVCLAVAVFWDNVRQPPRGEPDWWYRWGDVMCYAAGVAAMVLGVWLSFSVLRVYHAGVTRRTLFRGERTLRFDRLTKFGHFVAAGSGHPLPSSDTSILRFAGDDPEEGEIRWTGSNGHHDTDIATLIKQLDDVVAARLWDRWKAEGHVVVNDCITLQRTGVVVRERGLFGKGPVQFLPWAEVVAWELHPLSMSVTHQPPSAPPRVLRVAWSGDYNLNPLLRILPRVDADVGSSRPREPWRIPQPTA